MKKVAEHLDRIREQPHHVRHQFALGTAGALTGVIGLVWLVASLATGVFALEGTSFAEATGAVVETSSPNDVIEGNENVAGAAAAFEETDEKNAPARVEIVPSADAKPKEPAPKPDPTIIPF